MKHTLSARKSAACAAMASLAVVIATAAPAQAVDGNLPGGTSISVTISTPANGAVRPPGPVPVTGTAGVGTGVPLISTSLTYVLDVSGSTASTNGCGGDQDGDSTANTVLDCEIIAAKTLNGQTLVPPVAGTIGSVGAAAFGQTAAAADVGPAAGDQLFTGPGTDANGNGTRDIDEVLSGAFISGGLRQFPPTKNVGGSTSFADGITAAVTAATAPPDPAGRTLRRVVVFLSDGLNNGPDIDGPLAAVPGVVDIFTFAVGTGSGCGGPTGNTLQRIATTTGGTCTEVDDPADLPSILPSVISSELSTLSLQVDGGAFTPIGNGSINPDLPQTGPASVTYNTATAALTAGQHQICVRAFGSDGGGTGFVTDCRTIIINAPPVVSAGGPYSGQEGTPVGLAASVVDPDGPSLTTTWTIAPQSGVDAGATCAFANPAATATTVTCTDDGVWLLTETANDGINPPVSASTTLTLTNVAPQVSISAPANGTLYTRNTPVAFTAPFTDIGRNDSHTCTVNFDDGTPVANGTVAETPGSGTCKISHAFSAVGPHNVLVKVTDDDGGSATAVVRVVVYRPGGAFALEAKGLLLTIARTPDVVCPPNDARTTVAVNAAPLLTTGVLNASCVLDPATGTTTARATVDGANILSGLINLTAIESTSVSSASGITRTSRVVGTINGTPIGTSAPTTIGIPGVAVVYLNESTTNSSGQLVQNAVRVEVLGLLGVITETIILSDTYLG
ncbi:hypothetical protein F4553_002100 [Allocatelliglobosispora scoriae]|uniref:VWFA domain-containing protein n=1 Tax=Allocatelliglobosispora scoriae TaxID=643052 RepID=A0A841BPG3_9ACTN|nr:vWA domain-containing protein [Allocatelliglobosispora scoriae]MBB5868721.1 hypothetical protein [Allocatelliglobosispora scoriae]